ncbi:hypothetical protein TNCV_4523231 [Trichonephila clavipes]|nr:hypothetical protein TNCV_4523231 [Trichonephila clavipes]
MWSMAQRLTQITPPAATPDQLWQRVEASWSVVPQKHVQSLFESIPRRVAMRFNVTEFNFDYKKKRELHPKIRTGQGKEGHVPQSHCDLPLHRLPPTHACLEWVPHGRIFLAQKIHRSRDHATIFSNLLNIGHYEREMGNRILTAERLSP